MKHPTPLSYPVTRKTDVTDTYFGKEIADPYRWLEDDLSDETAAWVTAQNELTFSYLNEIPFKADIQERLKVLMNYPKASVPFVAGDITYVFRNDGLQNQYVLYKVGDDGVEDVFLDPNTFSEDGTVSLAGIEFSSDGKTAAYMISTGGSDWRQILIMDASTGEILEEPLVDVKFSGIAWKMNDGFFYSSYDKPDGSELSTKTDQHKLYYHKLGTSQAEDELVFGGTSEQKHRYVGASVTDEGEYLVVSASNTTSGTALFLKNLQAADGGWKTILTGYDNEAEYVDYHGGMLYLLTDLNAENRRLVRVSPEAPGQENWADVIPEGKDVLSVTKGAGYIFARYTIDAIESVIQFDYDGKSIRNVELPGPGGVMGFSGKRSQDVLYYGFANYHTPLTIFSFDPQSGESPIYSAPSIDFTPYDYVSTQVFYSSNDGTKVPMLITHRKGLTLDGSAPTILYGYGGFNVSLLPTFWETMAVWMEMGGIFAVPNLRGGGEYGKAWHDAGARLNKQNVFDDFIAAAEYLIAEKYTSKQKLAIHGGSNGGLLVGACMTQRPDLYQVALPDVGVLDMLRYHTFTAGAGWAYDYGNADQDEEIFTYLLSYSPLHNIVEGTRYPATMVTTADHDDRVVPAHSFKFAAELQDKHSGDSPVIIRIETNAGHGMGTPTAKIIEQAADRFAFCLWNMGFTSIPG